TIVIWSVSLAVAWQAFHWQHLIGFAILICGLCAYNGILPRPCWRKTQTAEDEDRIIDTEAVGHEELA
ncbi:jg23200, partial [Pararge aegeria aegeria]